MDDVLPFSEVVIPLASHDKTSPNAMFKVIHKKIVGVHFVISVRGENELTRTNATPHLL